MEPIAPPIRPDPEPIEQLLARPADQRLREYKYRCAQAIVFGLPVIGLQYLGSSIGGPEAPRWAAILQAVLAGWVVYIGAAGMLFEGLLVLRRRRAFTADLFAAILAAGCYFLSLALTVRHILDGRWRGSSPLLFHIAVAILALWCGLRWWQLARGASSLDHPS